VISMNKALFLYGGKSGGPGGVAAGLLKEEAKGRGDDEAESLQVDKGWDGPRGGGGGGGNGGKRVGDGRRGNLAGRGDPAEARE